MTVQPLTSEPSGAAQAAAPSAPLSDVIASEVLRRWSEMGLPAPAPFRLDHALLSRGSATKLVIALADPATAEYVAIAKVAPLTRGPEIVEGELRHLSLIHGALPPGSLLGASIPRPLGTLELLRGRVAVQSAIDGIRLTGLVRRDPHGPWLRLGAQWLIDFHGAMASRFRDGAPQHGDFALTNLFLRKDGTLGVIDWDYFGTEYPPMFDLFSLLNSWAFSRAEIRSSDTDVPRCAAAFGRAWLTDRWFVGQASTVIGGYCSSRGIPLASARRHFLEHLSCKLDRARGLYGSRHFYARLFHLVLDRARDEWPILTEVSDGEAND